jgi:hypothetical protein
MLLPELQNGVGIGRFRFRRARRSFRIRGLHLRQQNEGVCVMQQQISVITLGVVDLARSRRFYTDGFGWNPVFENEEIIFYQMNGLMLGTWLQSAFEGDMQRPGLSPTWSLCIGT